MVTVHVSVELGIILQEMQHFHQNARFIIDRHSTEYLNRGHQTPTYVVITHPSDGRTHFTNGEGQYIVEVDVV